MYAASAKCPSPFYLENASEFSKRKIYEEGSLIFHRPWAKALVHEQEINFYPESNYSESQI